MARVLRSKFTRLAATCVILVFSVGLTIWSQSAPLTIILTGQSMIRSDIRVTAPAAASTIASLLKGGDVVFTNYEGSVAEPGQPNESAPQHAAETVAPPATLDALKFVGFNLLSLSNNHSWDMGAPGIQNTLREVTRLNLAHAGIGNTLAEATAPGYLRTPKGTVALVGMASPTTGATATQPGANELRVGPGNKPNEEDTERILQSIREARKNADVVIVYQHNHIYDVNFGTMFAEELPDRLVPPDWIKKWTHAEVDAGADIVVMHGAPVVQGVEIYNHGAIFYDLGNFIFNLPTTNSGLEEPIIWESVIASLEYQGKKLQSIQFRAVALNKIGQGQPDAHDPHAITKFLSTRGLPSPVTGDKAGYILKRLADLSRPFGTTVDVKGDTAEINLKGAN